MIDINLTILKPYLVELEAQAEYISNEWSNRDRVKETLKKHIITTEFFRKHFGLKIYNYLLQVIKEEEGAGNCPVVHVMLQFYKDKGIKLHELYAICSELRNVIIFYFIKNMYKRVEDEVFWKLLQLLDSNFMGVIEEYIEKYYETVYISDTKSYQKSANIEDASCTLASKAIKKVAKETAQKVVAEEDTKEFSENDCRFKDIRFSKAERYGSKSLFEMLDDNVIDKIENFTEELDEMLVALYDIEAADAKVSYKRMGDVVEIFGNFYNLVDTLVAFPVIVSTFKNLADFLVRLDFDSYENSLRKELLVQNLIGLTKDLEKWLEIVFINKTAEDVHYFDASFANNVLEIEAIFHEKEIDGYDVDDLEFF